MSPIAGLRADDTHRLRGDLRGGRLTSHPPRWRSLPRSRAPAAPPRRWHRDARARGPRASTRPRRRSSRPTVRAVSIARPKMSRLRSSTPHRVGRNECRIATHLTPLRPLDDFDIRPDVVVQRRDLRAVHAERCDGVPNCCGDAGVVLASKRRRARAVLNRQEERSAVRRHRPAPFGGHDDGRRRLAG